MANRTPQVILDKLRELISKCESGPSITPVIGSFSAEERAAHNEIMWRQANWRSSWITPELRQILAWADGTHTASEIEYQGAGYRHSAVASVLAKDDR